MLPFLIESITLGVRVDNRYQFVVEDKYKKVINKTNFTCNFEDAKKLLHVLMYQTGVRYGYMLELSKGLFGTTLEKKVYDEVIIHEGE